MKDKIISVRIMPDGYGKASEEVRNYILNLHDEIDKLKQENERLKEILKWKQNRESELFTIESILETNKQLYDERNIYNSRCKKAIEYIKNCEIIDKDKRYPLLEEQFGEDLLNILEGDSNNERDV